VCVSSRTVPTFNCLRCFYLGRIGLKMANIEDIKKALDDFETYLNMIPEPDLEFM